ncbi:MAG: multicopper oxidase, partial [Rubrobacteraceae bacterium]|nr:multicopper oxidase [Rubrobacteraceae bacterium]
MAEKVKRPSVMSRRRFLGLVGLGAGALATGGYGALTLQRRKDSSSVLGVAEYELEAAPVSLGLGRRDVSTWSYNGGLPGPEIRVKEGQTLRATVLTRLPEDTTIHWHGVPLPTEMDGVPDVTQPAIKPGDSFSYEF